MRFSLRYLTLAAFVLLSYVHASGQREYLDEVFGIIEKNSINRSSVDFQKLRSEAYGKLGDVRSTPDCYPIVRSILAQLKDNHSFLMEKTQVDEWRSTSKRGEYKVTDAFSGRVINTDVGYIAMQGFSSGDSASLSAYANALQGLIRSLDNNRLKGWILDIRENTGGNCWPMLAGIGPLLGDGICGYFVGADSSKSPWFYEKGTSGSNSAVITRVTDEAYVLANRSSPIAVLTGSRTTSSGEVVATSFRGMVNARSFGENTGGLSTGNAGFTLSDGSMIFLTTSVYADRLGNAYGGEIVPDHVVEFDYNYEINTDADPVIKASIKWIYEVKK